MMTCSFHLIKKVHLEWEVKSFSLLIFCSPAASRGSLPGQLQGRDDGSGEEPGQPPGPATQGQVHAEPEVRLCPTLVLVQCMYSVVTTRYLYPGEQIRNKTFFLNCSLTKYQNIEKWPRFTSTKSLPLHQLTERFPFQPPASVMIEVSEDQHAPN